MKRKSKIKLRYTKSTFERYIHPRRPEIEKVQCHSVTDGTISAHADSREKATNLYNVHVFAQPAQDYKPYKPGTGSWL